MTRRVTSQVLFVDCQPGRAVVDGVLMEAAGPDAPAGMLITFVLKLPSSETVAAVVADTISSWAETGCLVEIELLGLGDAGRATFSDGQATLRLPLEAAA